MLAGASPQTSLGELIQRSPNPLAGFKGPLRGKRGMEGREGLGEGREKGRGKGEVRGNSALVVGEIDAP